MPPFSFAARPQSIPRVEQVQDVGSAVAVRIGARIEARIDVLAKMVANEDDVADVHAAIAIGVTIQ